MFKLAQSRTLNLEPWMQQAGSLVHLWCHAQHFPNLDLGQWLQDVQCAAPPCMGQRVQRRPLVPEHAPAIANRG